VTEAIQSIYLFYRHQNYSFFYLVHHRRTISDLTIGFTDHQAHIIECVAPLLPSSTVSIFVDCWSSLDHHSWTATIKRYILDGEATDYWLATGYTVSKHLYNWKRNSAPVPMEYIRITWYTVGLHMFRWHDKTW